MVSSSTSLLQQLLSWGRQVSNPVPAPAEPAPRTEPVPAGPDRLTLSSEARQQMTAEPPLSLVPAKPSTTAPPAETSRKGSLINLKA